MVVNNFNRNGVVSNNRKIFDIKPNSRFRQRTQNNTDSAYQQRLIRLYSDYVLCTGKVDYPPLKTFLDKFCFNAPNTNQTFEAQEFQAKNLQKIVDSLTLICDRIIEILAEIRALLFQEFKKLDFNQDQNCLRLVHERYCHLAAYLEPLAKITHKYGYLAQSNRQIEKIQDDIRYFCQYSEQFLNQPPKNGNPKSSFRRFDTYLQSLGDRVHSLTNLLIKNIEYEIK